MNELRKISTVLRAVRLTIWAGRKTRHDRLFLHRLYRCAVAILAVAAAVQVARADVPPAYPPQNTPAIQQMATARTGQTFSYNSQAGRMTIGEYQPGQVPRATFTRATPSLGQRSHPVRLTNNYGAVAQGQIQTQTAMPPTSTTAKLAAGMYATQIVGGALQHQGPAIGEAAARGDYKAAAQYGVLGTLQSAKDAGNWATGGLIGGVESVWDAYHNAKNPQNAGEALMQEAARKAEEAAKRYEQQYQQSSGFSDYLPQANGQPKTYPKFVVVNGGTMDGSIFFLPDWYNGGASGSYTGRISFPTGRGQEFSVGTFCRQCQEGKYYTVNTTPQNYDQYRDLVQKGVAQAQPQPTAEDFLLTQAEANQILLKYMEQMLNDNNRNHTELMNALWAGGALNPSNTQTMVSGSPADNTFLTEPFTPAGSDQAQQTQFVVNNNGTVTQTTINRPDLAANTSQAPTRAEVGKQQQAEDTRPAKENSSAEKPDICAQNPNSLMCAEAGNADYTDPVIPEKQIDFDFKPANIFSNDGVCPQPVTFEIFGKSYQFSYAQSCDFLRKVRPLIILAAMVTAMIMAYNAVKEL